MARILVGCTCVMVTPTGESFFFDWHFSLAIIWGFLILSAFIGWGHLLTTTLFPKQSSREGWGFVAALGMSAFLVLSGPLNFFSLFSIYFLTAFLLVGLGLSWRWWMHTPALTILPARLSRKVLICLLLFFIVLTYLGAVACRRYNENDDFPAYFVFSRMLLETGTIIDPFNFRLLGAMQGQPALVTLVTAYLPWGYANLLDKGVAEMILLGFAWNMVSVRDSRAQGIRLVLLGLALTYQIPRDNTASEMTGTVSFLALFQLLDLIAEKRLAGWQSVILLGIVIAAASTLRAHYIFVIIAIMGGFLFWRLLQERSPRLTLLKEALLLTLVVALLIAPWCGAIYRSSGAFLYPLIKGTQRPEFETFNLHLPLRQTLAFIGGFFIFSNILVFFAPMLALKPGPVRIRYLLLGLALMAVIMAFLSQYTFGDYFDLNRYLSPIAFAFGLHMAGLLARRILETRDVNSGRRLALALCATMVIIIQFPAFIFYRVLDAQSIVLAMIGKNQLCSSWYPISTDAAERNYSLALSQIPFGSKVFIGVDYPYLFNYRHHVLYSVDIAGAASPNPGLPYFHGSKAMRQYLLGQRFEYLAYSPFESAHFLHSRWHQEVDLSHDVAMYQLYAHYEMDFIDNVEAMAKVCPHVFDSPEICVIKLTP